MTIPLATTTISILRVSGGSADPYDAQPAASVVASGIRAHISPSSGLEIIGGGSQEVDLLRLACDVCDLRHTDEIVDDTTGEHYRVNWVNLRTGIIPGQDHVSAGIKQVTGLTAS